MYCLSRAHQRSSRTPAEARVDNSLGKQHIGLCRTCSECPTRFKVAQGQPPVGGAGIIPSPHAQESRTERPHLGYGSVGARCTALWSATMVLPVPAEPARRPATPPARRSRADRRPTRRRRSLSATPLVRRPPRPRWTPGRPPLHTVAPECHGPSHGSRRVAQLLASDAVRVAVVRPTNTRRRDDRRSRAGNWKLSGGRSAGCRD